MRLIDLSGTDQQTNEMACCGEAHKDYLGVGFLSGRESCPEIDSSPVR
jgi:hypothetical protein